MWPKNAGKLLIKDEPQHYVNVKQSWTSHGQHGAKNMAALYLLELQVTRTWGSSPPAPQTQQVLHGAQKDQGEIDGNEQIHSHDEECA